MDNEFEYGKLQLPVLTQTFILNVPFNTFIRMMNERSDNKRGGKDIHQRPTTKVAGLWLGTAEVVTARTQVRVSLQSAT